MIQLIVDIADGLFSWGWFILFIVTVLGVDKFNYKNETWGWIHSTAFNIMLFTAFISITYDVMTWLLT